MKPLVFRASALLLALYFLFFPAPSLGASASHPRAAGGSPVLDAGADAAAGWLVQALPAAGPGAADAVLALLRAGVVQPADAWTQDYLVSLQAHLAAGGAAGQTPALCSRQLMSMAAAGQAPDGALAAALWEAAWAEGAETETLWAALLAYAAAGLEPPKNAAHTLEDLARLLAGAANPDGGFGPDGGSNPADTARALQALALCGGAATAPARDAALAWLGGHAAAYGGFSVNGAPSAYAAAEAQLALACLNTDTLGPGAPDPAAAMAVFQSDDGGFTQNPDADADPALTSLCLLALAARARQAQGLAAAYSLQAGGNTGSQGPLWGGGENTPFFVWVLCALVAALLAAALLCLCLARRRRRGGRRRLRMEGRPYGGKPKKR